MARKKQIPAHIINDSCANCRFWNRLDDSDQSPEHDVVGECRRFPPQVVGLDMESEAAIQAFPETEARAWCGEHGRTIN